MISLDEAKDILISVIALSLALSIAVNGVGILLEPLRLILYISFFSISVGTGFVLHELGHKYVAILFGGKARFVMWWQGLIFALLTSLLGFIFVAPGAVYIQARVNKKQNGLISLAGPLVNLILGIIFIVLSKIISFHFGKVNVFGFAGHINIWLGLFNMLPVYPLDGSKIIEWNIGVWGMFLLIFLFLFFMG